MTLRNLFLFLASLLLLFNGVAQAQQAPSASTQTTPPGQDEPMPFALLMEGGNFLGVIPEEVTRENMSRYGLREPRGVGISKVLDSSPAAKAGLKQGDVILRFDNEPVTSVRKLNRLVTEAAPEQTVRLTISRNGSEQEISATLAQRKNFSQEFGNFQQGFEVTRPDRFTFALGSQRRIGVTTTNLTPQLADYFAIPGRKGVLITGVEENSPAAKAGLKAGDVITQVDGQPVDSAADLTRAINRKNEGEVILNIIRDKSPRTIGLTPERRQGAPFTMPGMMAAPQVGEIVIPQIQLPVIPEINISLPRMQLPVIPRTNIVIPRLPRMRTVSRPI